MIFGGGIPQIITVNNANQQVDGSYIFENPDYGKTIVRCYSTATDVINVAETFGKIHYNLMDLSNENEKFIYKIENNEVKISSYIGDDINLEIPDEIEGYPVTKIENCFGTFKTLKLPSKLKNIQFLYSRNLETINISEENQYYKVKEGILFNKNETELVFYPMAKEEKSYIIPEGVSGLGNGAFDGNMYLENIVIPKTMTRMGWHALNACNLNTITVKEGNKIYFSKDNILYENNQSGINIKTIPKEIKGNIQLAYGLKKIDTYTFKNLDNIESVEIPTTVKEVKQNAFKYCEKLKKIIVTPCTDEISEVNSGNLGFGGVGCDECKLYCEDNSATQKHAKKWDIDYEIIKPCKIEIKNNINKTVYYKDEDTLNLEGGIIAITYDNGSLLDLDMQSNLLKVNGYDNSTIGKKEVEIDYQGCRTCFNVMVVSKIRKIIEINIKQDPNKMEYIEGQNFESKGMKIEATYDDGTTEEINNYQVTNGSNLKLGQTSVTISYTENGVTKTVEQPITVNRKTITITSIRVKQEPNKKVYIEGQNFESTGMKIEATYNNGTTEEVSNYQVTNGSNL